MGCDSDILSTETLIESRRPQEAHTQAAERQRMSTPQQLTTQMTISEQSILETPHPL